jgi:ATP-dependent DNA helicase HFM1/MER3
VVKPRGQNDFAYAHTLDARLFAVLQQHAVDKPILVFCPTRKGTIPRLLVAPTDTRHSAGTISTARQLAKEYEATMKANQLLPWSIPLQCVIRYSTRRDIHRWLELIRLSMTKISLVSTAR